MNSISITAVTQNPQDILAQNGVNTPEKSGVNTPIFPVANESTGQTAEQKPNKYLYPEFGGPAGERYLLSLAQQFAPFALWRTWYAAVSYQAHGNSCYVGVSRLVDKRIRERDNGIKVAVKERKVYLDLAALEMRGWLTTTRVRKAHLEEDGSISYYAATEKDFTGFYNTAHDYHEWLHSAEYIEPERENVPLILSDAELTKRLIRFENYRRLLLCGKPGPKKERQDYYDGQLTRLEQKTNVQELNQYFDPAANRDSAYRISPTAYTQTGEASSFSTPGEKKSSGPTTIRNFESDNNPSKSKPNPSPVHIERGAAVNEVENELGYTEEELKHDHKKRGAAAAGIPADQYAKLSGEPDRTEQQAGSLESERPIRDLPPGVSIEGEQYARQYDDSNLIPSDVTRFKKIYSTAEQACDKFEDGQLFWKNFSKAKGAASKYASKRRNRKGHVTRVPYMLACLENAFNFSLEELVYLRTENPLYVDYSLWDVIAHLRETYEHKYCLGEIQVEYREWLQSLLDELEQCKEPKQRNNQTAWKYQ